MSNKKYHYYSIKYKNGSIAIRALTKKEAIEKFKEHLPNDTIISIIEAK